MERDLQLLCLCRKISLVADQCVWGELSSVWGQISPSDYRRIHTEVTPTVRDFSILSSLGDNTSSVIGPQGEWAIKTPVWRMIIMIVTQQSELLMAAVAPIQWTYWAEAGIKVSDISNQPRALFNIPRVYCIQNILKPGALSATWIH